MFKEEVLSQGLIRRVSEVVELCQAIIYEFLKKNPGKKFTNMEIKKELKIINSSNSSNRSLKKLFQFRIIKSEFIPGTRNGTTFFWME